MSAVGFQPSQPLALTTFIASREVVSVLGGSFADPGSSSGGALVVDQARATEVEAWVDNLSRVASFPPALQTMADTLRAVMLPCGQVSNYSLIRQVRSFVVRMLFFLFPLADLSGGFVIPFKTGRFSRKPVKPPRTSSGSRRFQTEEIQKF